MLQEGMLQGLHVACLHVAGVTCRKLACRRGGMLQGF